MIAANFRKHPEAMALQLVLRFGHALVWALPRPTTRVLRAIRVARAAAFKIAGRIVHPTKTTAPQWAKNLKHNAQTLAKAIKAACIALDFEETTLEPKNIRIKITPAIRNEWQTRCIEDVIPRLAETEWHTYNTLEITRTTAQQIADDCAFQLDPDGPELNIGEQRAYASLLRQCKDALKISGVGCA